MEGIKKGSYSWIGLLTGQGIEANGPTEPLL
jgi:hypothetical protein